MTKMTMQNFRFGLVLVDGHDQVWVDQIDPNPNYKPIGLAVRRSLAVQLFLLEGEGVGHF